MNTITLKKIDTGIGSFIAGVFENKLCLFDFEDRRYIHKILNKKSKQFDANIEYGDDPLFSQLETEIEEYLSNERKEFTLPLDIRGTPFQLKVWNELRKIPYGQTISYSEIAERIDNPNAVRGVGRANGDNNFAIIIPCHRVIDKNGDLRGYGGGLDRKKKLLNLENQSKLTSFF